MGQITPLTNKSEFERQAQYSRTDREGLLISRNTDTTKWDIESGRYWIVQNGVSTPHIIQAQAEIDKPALLNTSATVYVYGNSSGQIEYLATAPRFTSYNPDKVVLGVLTTADGGATINRAFSIQIDHGPLQRALLSNNNGIINTDGLGIALKAGVFEWSFAGGDLLALGRNVENDHYQRDVVTIAAADPVNIIVTDRFGNILQVGATPVYDRVDDGSGDPVGSLPLINGNNAGVSRIWLSATGTIVQLLPQEEHNSFNVAIERSSQESWIKPPLLDGFAFCNSLIHRGDITAGNHTNGNFSRLLGGGGSPKGTEVPAALTLLADIEVPTATNNIVFDETTAPGIGNFEQFKLVAVGKGDSATTSNVYLFINADSTLTNYRTNTSALRVSGSVGEVYGDEASPIVGLLNNIDRKQEIEASINILGSQFSFKQIGQYTFDDGGTIRVGRYESSGQKLDSSGTVTSASSLTLNSATNNFDAGYRALLYGIR